MESRILFFKVFFTTKHMNAVVLLKDILLLHEKKKRLARLCFHGQDAFMIEVQKLEVP
jgi:hypothetical protein